MFYDANFKRSGRQYSNFVGKGNTGLKRQRRMYHPQGQVLSWESLEEYIIDISQGLNQACSWISASHLELLNLMNHHLPKGQNSF